MMSEEASHAGTPSDSAQQPNVRFVQHVNLANLNDKKKGFVASVGHSEALNVVHGESLLRMFADMFPPADLFQRHFVNSRLSTRSCATFLMYTYQLCSNTHQAAS